MSGVIMSYHLIMLCLLEKTDQYLKYHEPLQNWPSHIILSKLLYYFAMLSRSYLARGQR